MRIHRLSEALANQIAAGEVVERPASVVKELVENAVDAHATKISVQFTEGGLGLLSVGDDGDGMSREEAQLAVERHATSKISAFEDLSHLRTFGFRGEALPSIASVSHLEIITRRREDSEGTRVSVEGGASPVVTPAGCSTGTTISVRDLFFNVPARKKFLKSAGTESGHVGDVVLLSALARPDVSFTLRRDGKLVREFLRVATREERATQALSSSDKLSRCAGARGPVQIEAYLAPPERARAGSGGLYLFVNARPVRDRLLARAVAQAYGSVLESGRFPFGVVYIDLPPEDVDVNVHPQKAEVRFLAGQAVFDAVMKELQNGLARVFNLPALGPRPPMWGGASRSTSSVPPRAPGASQSSSFPPGEMRVEDIPTAVSMQWTGPLSVARGSHAEPVVLQPTLPEIFGEKSFYGSLRFIAQVRSTFLICQGEDGIYILDQHAAAERVTFDRLRRAFESKSVVSQRLLVPEVIELRAAEVSALTDNEAEILRLGVEVRPTGPSSVAIHAIPKIVARLPPERLVRDLVAELTREATRPFGGARDLVLATMACHGSIRAGDTLSAEEANALLSALDEVDFAGHCPHGRPVITRLSYAELERRVGR